MIEEPFGVFEKRLATEFSDKLPEYMIVVGVSVGDDASSLKQCAHLLVIMGMSFVGAQVTRDSERCGKEALSAVGDL